MVKSFRMIAQWMILGAVLAPLAAQSDIQFHLVGEWGAGPYQDVACSGNYGLCAAQGGGVDIIDLSDPLQPRKVGQLPEANASGIFVQGELAYVTGSGLSVWDVANPLAPALRGRYQSPGIYMGGWDVFVAGTTAFVVDWNNGLHLIDVSNPAAPAGVGFFAQAGAADVYVSGRYAYVAAYTSRLLILDVADPANPQFVAERPVATGEFTDGIWVSGDRAYFLQTLGHDSILEILDVSEPAPPVLLGTFQRSGYFDFVSVQGDIAYITSTTEFLAVDVSQPAAPVLLGALPVGGLERAVSHAIRLPYAFQACFEDGLRAIGLDDPSQLTLKGRFDQSGFPMSIAVDQNFAYIGEFRSVKNLDISTPGQYVEAGTCVLDWGGFGQDYAYDLMGGDGWLAVANGSAGVKWVNVQDPAAPFVACGGNTPNRARNLDIEGHAAFVADTASLRVLDTENCFSQIGFYDDNCDPRKVRAIWPYVYMAETSPGFGGLQILDVSNPAAPAFVGGYDIPETGATGLDIGWPYAYLAGGTNRVYILDLTHRAAPQLVSTFDVPGAVNNLENTGDFLFVFDTVGVHLLDVSNRARPLLIAGWEGCAAVDGDFEEEGNYLHLVGGANGKVACLQATWPEQSVQVHYNPEQSGRVFPDTPSQVAPATWLTFQVAPYAFLEASAEGCVVIALTLPPSVKLSQTLATGTRETTAPLPSNGETVVDLAVSEYTPNPTTGLPEPVAGPVLADLSPHAVQLLRYVAGESVIWIRVTQSTIRWIPSTAENFLGFTIGLGGGTWPVNAHTNWGESGMLAQSATLFYLDLREYDFEMAYNQLPVALSIFYQYWDDPNTTSIEPEQLQLFRLEGVVEEAAPAVSQVGSTVTDLALADMNGDGREDLVTVDGVQGRLYVAYGQADGTFQDLQWWPAGCDPTAVDAGDVSGDGRPDVLVGCADGTLAVHLWEELYGVPGGKAAAPAVYLRLSGAPVDTLLEDVTGDGWSDYLYTEVAGNKLEVLAGNAFTPAGSYATGAEPVALTGGDFDGDGDVDVAVANRGSGSVTVYTNDGAGVFGAAELSGVGSQPVDLDAADFNVDGRDDLAVALSGDKALAVLLRGAGGGFDPGAGQKVYFAKTPSAVVADNFDGQLGPDALVGFADWNKLSLCLADAAGVVSYAYNLDTLGDVVVDPFNNVTLAADSIITVGAGTSLGGVSSQQGMAGVSQREFGVVHFPQSSAISFSVVNLAAGDALVQLELYGDNGQVETTAAVTLGAGTQYARYFTDVLGPGAAAADRWVRGFLSVGGAYGLWLVNDAGLNYLDGTRAPDVREAQSALVVAEVRGETRLVLINPHKEAVQATLTVRGGEGEVKGTVAKRLGGRTRAVVDVGTLARTVGSGDWVEVRADRGLMGVEIFGDGKAKGCLAGLGLGEEGRLVYSPHVAVGDFGGVEYRTELTVINTGAYESSPRVVLVDDGGAAVASVEVVVPARGKRVVDLGPALGLTGAATGYLRLEGVGAGRLTGCVTFGEAAGGRFLSCLPLLAGGGSDYLLGHIANGTIGGVPFFTGLAVLNVGSGTVAATVRAYDEAGLQRGEAVLTLDPKRRTVALLSGLMPELTSLFGGYLRIDAPAGSELQVFELFGDDSLNFLSAVPAAPLPAE